MARIAFNGRPPKLKERPKAALFIVYYSGLKASFLVYAFGVMYDRSDRKIDRHFAVVA